MATRGGWILGCGIFAALAFLGTCRYLMRDRPMILPPGERRDVSALAYLDPEGRPHTLVESKGKIVLLHAWNTQRGYRMNTLEELARLQRREDSTFTVLAVALDAGGSRDVLAFMKDHPDLALRWSLPARLSSFSEPLGGFIQLPRTYVIDRQGRLREEIALRSSRKIEAALQAAIREP